MGVENPRRPKNPYNPDDEVWGNRDAYRTFIKPVEQPKVPEKPVVQVKVVTPTVKK